MVGIFSISVRYIAKEKLGKYYEKGSADGGMDEEDVEGMVLSYC